MASSGNDSWKLIMHLQRERVSFPYSCLYSVVSYSRKVKIYYNYSKRVPSTQGMITCEQTSLAGRWSHPVWKPQALFRAREIWGHWAYPLHAVLKVLSGGWEGERSLSQAGNEAWEQQVKLYRCSPVSHRVLGYSSEDVNHNFPLSLNSTGRGSLSIPQRCYHLLCTGWEHKWYIDSDFLKW